ncbi:replication factor C subunit 1 [Protopterus annectens]|uniref:replication factor C subunit 1 n=1 Tax=Protopterus annectens TaxID=7888 RepID=UPI001CF9BE5F|nr:replication factor C subunit 1 [Protopterus annectens]
MLHDLNVYVTSSCDEINIAHRRIDLFLEEIFDIDAHSFLTINSDIDESPPVKKSTVVSKNSSSKLATSLLRRESVDCVPETDEEDSDIKTPPKSKENGICAVSHPGASDSGKKVNAKPQVKVKPFSPVKLTPTSVLDYFGSSSIQRSAKKIVASKLKPVTDVNDLTRDDEAIAKQLQLEEDAEFERQLHEDEEFAQTLALLDEPPQNKKARMDSGDKSSSITIRTSPGKAPDLFQGAKKTSEKIEREVHSPVHCETFTKKQDTPLKASSKLALMKQKDDMKKKSVDVPKAGNVCAVSAKREASTSPEKKGTQNVQKERTSENKKETSTPKKKISPQKVVVNSIQKEKTSSPQDQTVSPKKSESENTTESEKKRQNFMAYKNFLNREGPRALGSKDIPQGADNCLEGLTFVITGVLESIERDEAKSLIERYGGKVTGNISKKTSYLVMGRDAGASKSEKAASLGTKVINEDGLLDLIRNSPGKKSKYEVAAEAEAKKSESKRTPEKNAKKTPQKATRTSPRISPRKSGNKKMTTPSKESKESYKPDKGKSFGMKKVLFCKNEPDEKQTKQQDENLGEDSCMAKEDGLLWVDKYKPTSLKAVIGQQGEQSCASKLLRWLRNWHKNNSGKPKAVAKFNKFSTKDDGSSFKAALLSGPPGVGKTTTAVLVCQDLGYSYVELNASDTRSKNSLKVVVAESLNNTSIKEFYSGTANMVGNNHVLIMDEVDGMAGNEDRGGIQELIGLIKQTKIPIICMCNDRNHPKIRSLVNYCFDLRFQKPRLEQIKGAMMTVAFKEGLRIPPPAMNEIILGANQDIRQVLHNLSMWSAKEKVMTYDQAKQNANSAKKDIKLGPFDVARKVFAAGEETAHMSLIDKSDLFFYDYSLAPLFVQENYVHVKPVAAGGDLKKHLMLLSKTADSICDGDLVDRQIRSNQSWGLLPTQAIYASVIPGELMRGYLSQFPSFPSWLGKYSSTGKHDRITQDLATHMCLRTHSSKRAINLDHLSYLRDALVRPLANHGVDGVKKTVELMEAYYLMKEDVDNIMEICSWGGKPDPFSKLDPKVKAAFTRAYNKESHLTPYSLQAVKKTKRGGGGIPETEFGEEMDTGDALTEETAADENIETDAMIKRKKEKASKTEKNEDTSKGKGRGKGKKTKC